MHLLLADDDEGTRFVVKRTLAALGMAIDVHEARDGKEALDLLEARRFDAILTDYRMPHATGVEVLHRAMQMQPHARRILMSGTLHEAILRDAVAPGCADFCFEKPMRRDEWLRLLRIGLVLEA
ncbi:MAG: two-component system, response regulator YesN [Thermoplasmata archaeon]|jgi:CheY-like chemotaxis protein|nr:two-component system, response regulator YesN [Thermoplasmata archaeon]